MAGERLEQKRDIKSILTELCRPLLKLWHARWKWRQFREVTSPGDARDDYGPDEHPRRSVGGQERFYT